MATRTPTLEDEYRALTEGAAVLDRSGRGQLDVEGPDALEYLHGQVTNDIEALEPGGGCYAALLDPKAHILADMRVLARNTEELWIDTEPAALDPTLANLRMYKIGRRVDVADRTGERGIVSLAGPRAGDVARAAFGPGELPDHEHGFVETTLHGDPVLVVRTDLGWDVVTAAGAVPGVIASLVEHGAVPASEQSFEIARIEGGRGRYGLDMSDANLPAEAGIVERAVSFTKGCYIGQEPVARMHYKGRPNRHLRGLELTGPAEGGEPLFASDGKEVGRVTSACVSPALGPIALALVRREVPPGDEVELGEGELRGTVVELPFLRRKVA